MLVCGPTSLRLGTEIDGQDGIFSMLEDMLVKGILWIISEAKVSFTNIVS